MGGPVGKVISQEDIGLKIAFPPVVKCMIQIQVIAFDPGFCNGIQAAAPVDSYVTPEPWPMPGYDSDVIMAAGAFVQGSSIELSADGPIREPYAIYFQGGLTWYHAKVGILMSLQKMVEAGLVTL